MHLSRHVNGRMKNRDEDFDWVFMIIVLMIMMTAGRKVTEFDVNTKHTTNKQFYIRANQPTCLCGRPQRKKPHSVLCHKTHKKSLSVMVQGYFTSAPPME